ncbi:Cys2-His2 zinc finger transcription factor ACEI [Beauveria bassiana ARSEF 2860]|uniref:Cys2-His2 zinc finger transcription factor ACEI n=1 Tax=Beauveria bassiana (strain ARSEF 2860) TaxID=655819 RepID=J4WL00_BEAB2|nr:Cys2-His2 zinc finger transcription factor ACEI [Beauveria bassiana ARSEF 2860]EJP70420.1 Cys2-His2 zinc finger transcription factor ACEI [Beauveria bassiana ARSEF 2860]
MSFSNPRRRMMTRSEPIAENKMTTKAVTSLQKGATFHSPSSPNFHSLDDGYLPPRLTRSQSHLNDVSANRRRMILTTIEDIDKALGNISLSDSKPKKESTLSDTATPIPRDFFHVPVVDPAMAKEQGRPVLRPRSVGRNRHHASDSGLGTSIASINDKVSAADTFPKKITKKQAATRTAAASNTHHAPALSTKAVNIIRDHTLHPLLQKPSLKPFETIVLDIYSRIHSKDITCLRDVEKALEQIARRATPRALCVDFYLTSIICVATTFECIHENERVRPGDRPYSGGYIADRIATIDLKEQLEYYGRLLATKDIGDLPAGIGIDEGDILRLHGGPCVNGRPAEFVRVKKDGTAFSMATGEPVDLKEAPIKLKRCLSEKSDDDEEIMRSMARRKKNATPEELAPKKCREPGCNKEFKRPCDLTKHEKTHSRPWKCPFSTCKYHNYGWPTEKEMDRHVNDKHSDAPAMYECTYKPCAYKSKRESNCKQHMEKAHGWVYVRTKSSGKKLPLKPADEGTPAITNLSPPMTTPSYSVPTPPQDNVLQDMPADFPMYPDDSDWLASVERVPEHIDTMDLVENQSPSSSASSYEQYPPYQNGSTFIINDEDIYAARMQLPPHMPSAEQFYHKLIHGQMPDILMAPPTAVPLMEVPTHFSPTGQGNTMLYTPVSLRDMDEAFDGSFGGEDVDFQLYDNSAGKFNEAQSLFGELPSANMGFSQNTQPEMFAPMDLNALDTLDYSIFQA